jgi:hypothetical protein
MLYKMHRTTLFYAGCIPVRLSVATILLIGINPMIGPVSVFACVALIMAAGFVRNHWTHKEVGFFGGKVWWHGLRNFHAGIWVTIAILLFLDIRYAGVLILYDIIPGIIQKCQLITQ